MKYEKQNPNAQIYRVVYFFLTPRGDSSPDEAMQEEYLSEQEAIDALPQLLHESIDIVTQVALYESNEDREFVRYIDSIDRDILDARR
jgi:hypothetical protein